MTDVGSPQGRTKTAQMSYTPAGQLAPIQHAPLPVDASYSAPECISNIAYLVARPFSIYLRVPSLLALTALRHWAAMELAWR
jgi:hypothetical protein